ncbi:ankyrin repeat and BTB/POZ domain-containing protein 1-like [Haliotis rufescens]|uniref:ankyrin repeat and BTB/POZ domain-containing protein 1-like n=1 Tax=Haliotis rufescens TaxID=6454 RepID=UPI001EB09985|nr:ankyrin repeat and BTB/POZ domain-containing protein 1-like [Haliotis rufescens]
MDVVALYDSCRVGDLQKVKFLVEEREVELNTRDKWDSTPLYYACLCGHKDVVQYLLEHGAKCEANTFDGERCLYGALTDEIRTILKKFRVISSRTIRRDMYEECLRKIREGAAYHDAVFVVDGVKFPVHRCILSVRCSYFAELFKTRWRDRQEVELKHALVSPCAFGAVLDYIYYGRLQVHVDLIHDCVMIAKQCQMHCLIDQIEDRMEKDASFLSMKPGLKVTSVVIEPPLDSLGLQMDLGLLGDRALPVELNKLVVGELPFDPDLSQIYPDVCFSVEGLSFMCHKVFLSGRSDYFKALIEDHFGETTLHGNTDIPVVTLHNITPQVFGRVVQYVYQDLCELSAENVYDILCVADLYILPGLKRLCANCMGEYIDINNIITILRTSRLFSLRKLENECAEFIAENLEEVIAQEDFIKLVKEDAANLQERHETDTIDIIDEVRFYITNFIQTYSEMQEANERLKLIDDLLEELYLEG